MNTSDLERYCEKSIQAGATDAKIIHPSTVVTAPWVRIKCMFGCQYQRYNCPPHSPTPAETRAILDAYKRAILFRCEAPASKERGRKNVAYFNALIDLEGEIFKDGYYKAFVMIAGPCYMCKECGKFTGVPCRNPGKPRPSMEAMGIDVYQTARNNDFFIITLKDKSETQNLYCLMLVD